MADPPRASQSGLHPDDVADDRGAGVRLAAPAQRRSVPRDQRAGHPGRDLLHGRGSGRHREDDHRADRARGGGVARRRPRREPVPAGVLVGQRLVQLRRRPGQRAVRGVAAGGPDPEHAAVRHPAAVHHQVRHHQHPGRADRGQRRGAGRTPALRPRLQHDRTPDRAHQRRRQRQRRRRSDPGDRGQGEAGRAACPQPRHPGRRRRGQGIEPAAAERPPQGRARATTTSSPTRRSRRRARSAR